MNSRIALFNETLFVFGSVIVGAGSVIARDVPADALAVVRAEQVHKDGWAAKKRAEEKELKAAKAAPKSPKGS